GVFNGPLMARATQLAQQGEYLDKARQGREFDKVAQLALTITRTAALLIDPTIRRASLLAGNMALVNSALQRKDFAGAVQTLDSALR
ncbi:MAG: hypothetical protein KGR26_01355, partial [Cyanobacteria bacterium REEB65]|nr:hypothetical protein [Cyanobacteria bacterium REEB65]